MKFGMLAALILATACGSVTMAQTPAAPMTSAPMAAASTPAVADKDYKLGVADKIRILVFNEPTLSGEFQVNANGSVAVPLVGDVPAVGRTTSDLNSDITAKLSDGYLRDPKVSIDVLTFRPFYILGEVNKPGQYEYSTGLTVLNAVATAQGFTYRAEKHKVFIKHPGDATETAVKLESGLQVSPGDTIRIGERYF
jgi:protein involved in polysaccharide export with SLBB domain